MNDPGAAAIRDGQAWSNMSRVVHEVLVQAIFRRRVQMIAAALQLGAAALIDTGRTAQYQRPEPQGSHPRVGLNHRAQIHVQPFGHADHQIGAAASLLKISISFSCRMMRSLVP